MRILKCSLCLLLCALLLTSCGSGGSEPEQIYLASSIGFDRSGEQIRLSVEVPISKESETEGMETKLFVGEGATPEEALRRITAGLSRELSFSHCALMVLGEDLTAAQSDAAFRFAAKGAYLPIAAQVVSTANAEQLLSGGSLSTPAAGYDIPSILREVSSLLGLELRTRVYELWSTAKAEVEGATLPTVLPYLEPTGEGDPRPALFAGLSLMRRDGPTLRLSVNESVAYAMLIDRFCGTTGAAGSFGDVELRRVRQALQGVWAEERLTFVLRIEMTAAKEADAESIKHLEEQITQSTSALFQKLQGLAGEDLLGFRSRAEGLPAEWSEQTYTAAFLSASLEVHCRITGEETHREKK